MDNQLYDVFVLGLRTFYILAVPLIVVTFIAGSLASLLQSALSVQEATMNYALRLMAVVIVLYLLIPSAVQNVLELTQSALR